MSEFLSDHDLEELEKNPTYRRAEGKCPTCEGEGFYRYKGQEHECPKDTYGRHEQELLFRKYCLANIPAEFFPLDLNDFPHPEILTDVRGYLAQFPTLRWSGLGYEIFGKSKGVGKTYLATAMLKTLVKGGYPGWFMQFQDALNVRRLSDRRREWTTDKLRNSEILVLDEVLEPTTDAQRDLFERELEAVIRERTSNNRPTIITTNLVVDEMEHHYPRIYSLLSAKQFRVELSGDDYRKEAWYENEVVGLNGEVRPIV